MSIQWIKIPPQPTVLILQFHDLMQTCPFLILWTYSEDIYLHFLLPYFANLLNNQKMNEKYTYIKEKLLKCIKRHRSVSLNFTLAIPWCSALDRVCSFFKGGFHNAQEHIRNNYFHTVKAAASFLGLSNCFRNGSQLFPHVCSHKPTLLLIKIRKEVFCTDPHTFQITFFLKDLVFGNWRFRSMLSQSLYFPFPLFRKSEQPVFVQLIWQH